AREVRARPIGDRRAALTAAAAHSASAAIGCFRYLERSRATTFCLRSDGRWAAPRPAAKIAQPRRRYRVVPEAPRPDCTRSQSTTHPKGPTTRLTAPAYWKFESISLQR